MTIAQAKQLYNDGDKEQGRAVLIAYLKTTPEDAKAWAYLGAKSTDLEQRKYCYLKSLELAEDNTIQARLDKLDEYDPVAPPEFTAKKAVKSVKKASVTPPPVPKKSNLWLILGIMGGLFFLCFCACAFIGAIAPKPKPTPNPVAIATQTEQPTPIPNSTIALTTLTTDTATLEPTVDAPLPTAYIMTTTYNKWSFLVKRSEVISTPHGAGLALIGDLVNGESAEDCWHEYNWNLKNEFSPFAMPADKDLSNQLAAQYSVISPASDLDGVCVGAGETKTIILAFDVYPTSAMSLDMYTGDSVTFTVDVANIPPPPPTATPDNSYFAELRCQDFVEKRLKAPSTADFGGFLDDRSDAQFVPLEKAKERLSADIIAQIRNPNGLWAVQGYVDSENAFGTMLRADYSCVLDNDPVDDSWYALSVDIKSR